MSQQTPRSWEACIGNVEVISYADGDVTIQDATDPVTGSGHVLSPKQVSKFCTRAELVRTEEGPVGYTVGHNCVGDNFEVRTAREPSQYMLGHSGEWITIKERQLAEIVEKLRTRE